MNIVIKRTLSYSLLCSVFSGASLLSPTTAVAETGKVFKPIQLANVIDGADKAVVMWSAFGSGCQAVEETPINERDIDLRILPKNAVQIPQLAFSLSFAKFHLPGKKQFEKDNIIEMYSECALRFAIRGQPGRRLKKIEGQATIDIRKSKGATLYVHNELKFGQYGADEKKLDYNEKTDVQDTNFKLNLSKVLDTHRPGDGKSSCGSDEVLFYDFTLSGKKLKKSSEVRVSFPSPSEVTVRLDYEAC